MRASVNPKKAASSAYGDSEGNRSEELSCFGDSMMLDVSFTHSYVSDKKNKDTCTIHHRGTTTHQPIKCRASLT